jgi:hypothetical protein
MLRILPEQLFDAKQLDCHAQHGYGQENIPCIDLGGRVDWIGDGGRDKYGTSQDGDDLKMLIRVLISQRATSELTVEGIVSDYDLRLDSLRRRFVLMRL